MDGITTIAAAGAGKVLERSFKNRDAGEASETGRSGLGAQVNKLGQAAANLGNRQVYLAGAPQQVTAQVSPSPSGEGGRRLGNLLAQAPKAA